MTKRKTSFLKPVHFQALVFIILYFFLSIFVLVRAVTLPNIYVSFLVSLAFGVISVFVFLYLFSHEDFFPFFKNLDKFEHKQEKGYLGNFILSGKFLTCVLIGTVGGQIFLALSIRFLFPKSKNKYWIAFLATLVSTIIVVFFGKRILSIIRVKL